MDEEMLAFWRAWLDEDEADAWSVHDVVKCDAILYEDLPDVDPRDVHCDCGYPDRVRREVKASRVILSEYARALEKAPANSPLHNALRRILRVKTAVHSSHPDYREEWAP